MFFFLIYYEQMDYNNMDMTRIERKKVVCLSSWSPAGCGQTHK